MTAARSDGITVTRWALGLSVTVALVVLGGGFGLLWDRIGALETRIGDGEATDRGILAQVAEINANVKVLLREHGIAATAVPDSSVTLEDASELCFASEDKRAERDALYLAGALTAGFVDQYRPPGTPPTPGAMLPEDVYAYIDSTTSYPGYIECMKAHGFLEGFRQ